MYTRADKPKTQRRPVPELSLHAIYTGNQYGSAYTCKHCKKKFDGYSWSANNIRRHLREKHRVAYYPFVIKEEVDVQELISA